MKQLGGSGKSIIRVRRVRSGKTGKARSSNMRGSQWSHLSYCFVHAKRCTAGIRNSKTAEVTVPTLNSGAVQLLITFSKNSSSKIVAPHFVKSRARAAVVLFTLSQTEFRSAMLACTRTLWLSKELLFPNSSSTLFNNGVCSKACKLSLLVLKIVPSNSKQNKSLLLPTSKSLQRT